jgi:hypothetical protein
VVYICLLDLVNFGHVVISIARPVLANETVCVLNGEDTEHFIGVDRGRHLVTNVGIRGVLLSVSPSTVCRPKGGLLVLDEHRLEIQVITMVNNPWWRLLEILRAVGCEGSHILGS